MSQSPFYFLSSDQITEVDGRRLEKRYRDALKPGSIIADSVGQAHQLPRDTTVLVCESALALAVDEDRLPGGVGRGGVLTPAVALGDELVAIAQEVVRGDYLDRVHLGLDYFITHFDPAAQRLSAVIIELCVLAHAARPASASGAARKCSGNAGTCL